MRRSTALVMAAVLAVLGTAAAPQQTVKPLPWLGMGFTWIDASPSHRALKVQKVTTAGPAERAGLRPDDVITTVDDGPVDFGDDLDFLLFLEQHKPGDRLTFTVLRDGKPLRIPIVLGTMPDASRTKWQQALETARRHRLDAEAARTTHR